MRTFKQKRTYCSNIRFDSFIPSTNNFLYHANRKNIHAVTKQIYQLNENVCENLFLKSLEIILERHQSLRQMIYKRDYTSYQFSFLDPINFKTEFHQQKNGTEMNENQVKEKLICFTHDHLEQMLELEETILSKFFLFQYGREKYFVNLRFTFYQKFYHFNCTFCIFKCIRKRIFRKIEI